MLSASCLLLNLLLVIWERCGCFSLLAIPELCLSLVTLCRPCWHPMGAWDRGAHTGKMATLSCSAPSSPGPGLTAPCCTFIFSNTSRSSNVLPGLGSVWHSRYALDCFALCLWRLFLNLMVSGAVPVTCMWRFWRWSHLILSARNGR